MSHKNLIKAAVYIFAVTSVISFALFLIGEKPWIPYFIKPLLLTYICLLSIFLIYLPSIFFKTQDPEKKKMVTELQSVISAALLLNLGGEFGLFKLYKIGFQYDKLLHFTVPLLMTIEAARFFAVWRKISFKKSVLQAGLSVLVSGVIWEIWEFSSDLFLGTNVWGVEGNFGWSDTIGDMSFNTIGIIIAIFILTFFDKKAGAKETARINRAEDENE